MKNAIILCILLMLVIVPVSVLAEGQNGQDASGWQGKRHCFLDRLFQGQGSCLQNNQTCSDTACQARANLKEQHRYGIEPGGTNTTAQTSSVASDSDKLQTRTMRHLRNGSCGGCKKDTE